MDFLSEEDSSLDLSLDGGIISGAEDQQEDENDEFEEDEDEEQQVDSPHTPPPQVLLDLQELEDEIIPSPETSQSSTSQSSTGRSAQLPDNPNFQLVQPLSVPETVVSITFGDVGPFERDGWKSEFRIISEKIRHRSNSDTSLAAMVKILFEQLAAIFSHPDCGIFPESISPNDKYLAFGKFMATLNLIKVSRLSFPEIENPNFERFWSALNLPMSLTLFKLTLDRLSKAIFDSKGSLLRKMEKAFTKTNVSLFYDQSIAIGADDDKQPTRNESLSDINIKKKGGRGSRTFPVADEFNTINGYFTIGRATQTFEDSTYNSVSGLLDIIRTVTRQNNVQNLFFLDRGYDDASDLFTEWFGTLKRSSRCIYIEPTPKRPQKYRNQIVIKPMGCQVVYVTRVILNGKRQLQTAQCIAGTSTYFTHVCFQPYSFNLNIII